MHHVKRWTRISIIWVLSLLVAASLIVRFVPDPPQHLHRHHHHIERTVKP